MTRNFRRQIIKGPAAYFLAAPTRDHMPIFEYSALAEQAVLQLGRAAATGAAIAGYAIMPTSMMAIVAFKGDHDLGKFMYEYKKLSALAIVGLDHGDFHEALYRKGKFRPWMGRFDRMVIGSKDQLLRRLDYLHFEPIRRGLAKDPIEYPYSSAADYAGKGAGLITIERNLDWTGII